MSGPDRCPECTARRERVFAGHKRYAEFRVGLVVAGRCDRCTFHAAHSRLVAMEKDSRKNT